MISGGNNNLSQRDSKNNNVNMSSNGKIKKISQFNLRFLGNINDLKIGKINDLYNPERTIIEKEPNSKSYKITERKLNDDKNKTCFTGNLMAEQTSKYLIFKTKPNSDIIEVMPADSWFMFKKDINYKTINYEEAEEKIKLKSHIVDCLKNKGPSNNISAKNKKDKKERKISDEIPTRNSKAKKNFEEDEDEDDHKPFKRVGKPTEEEEIEEKDMTDLDLKEMPSDIEENFFGKSDKKKVKLFESDQEISRGAEDLENDSVDSLFEKNKENSEVEDDDDISEIDRKYANVNRNENEKLLGEKRRNDSNFMSDSRRSQLDLKEVVVNLLTKNKSLTKDSIIKELRKSGISSSEIETRLDYLLKSMCSRYSEEGEVKFFLKNYT